MMSLCQPDPEKAEPNNPIASTSPSNLAKPNSESCSSSSATKKLSPWKRAYGILTYAPPDCRWDPKQPPQFSLAMNVLFAFAAGTTVANLYYSHPILNVLAKEFGIRYEEVARIPTVMQAGYAVGLLFLCPLGDLVPRRPFVCGLVFFTATMWLGLCVTSHFGTFTAISFIVAVTTVTPQIMLPLVGDLAPVNQRASALSIVVSGLMLGVLVARVLSGTMTNFVTWRAIYWMALGLQYFSFILLWLFMPDYPATNPGIDYLAILWHMLKMPFRHPALVQACLAGLLCSAPFTSFWTTLTFLLSGKPYHYSSLIIGLFGLIGILGMLISPLWARKMTDRFVPHFSIIFGLSCSLIGVCLGTYIGTFNIAGPVLQAFLVDLGNQTAQIAQRSRIFTIEPNRRSSCNTIFMLSTFCGQLIGTATGSRIYAISGWIGSGSASVGFIGAALLVTCARGPWEENWAGWKGGWSLRKKNVHSADGKTTETSRLGGEKTTDEELGQEEHIPKGFPVRKIMKGTRKISFEKRRDKRDTDKGQDGNRARQIEG